MTYLEAMDHLDDVETHVKFALKQLQEYNIKGALLYGYQPISEELADYRAAIEYLIEKDQAKLLYRHYQKTSEVVSKAVPLLRKVFFDMLHSGEHIGEVEAKGNVWGIDIQALLETRVLPWLKDNHEEVFAMGSKTNPDKPKTQEKNVQQTQGNKPQQVPSWATTDVAKRAFAKAVERGYMSPLAYGYEWKKSKALLAYLVERLSKATIMKPYPDKEACDYFHTTNLRQSRGTYLNSRNHNGKPNNFEEIDALFK